MSQVDVRCSSCLIALGQGSVKAVPQQYESLCPTYCGYTHSAGSLMATPMGFSTSTKTARRSRFVAFVRSEHRLAAF